MLAQIYSGKITKWNNSAIAALNKGVTLPSTTIVPLHRADSSGSTFLFTSYMNAQDPSGWTGSNVGTTVSWPSVPGATAETGSGGMVKGCAGIKGCIAYIGISYAAEVAKDSLGTAALANKGGQFVSASTSTITPGAGDLLRQDAGVGGPVADQRHGRLPGHQLRVRDREDDAAQLGRGNRGEELPHLGNHHG